METTYSYFITHLTALEYLLVEQNNLVSFICITISPSVYKSILLLLCYSLGCPSTHCYFLNRTIYWLLHMYEWNFLSAPVSIQSFFGVSYVFYLFHPSKYYPEIQCFEWPTELKKPVYCGYRNMFVQCDKLLNL